MIACQALLFDLDGTLVDSTATVERTWASWASIQGLDPHKVIAASHGRRAMDTLRDFAPSSNLISEMARLEAIELSELDAVTALPGSKEVLEMLDHHQWAIVTSGTRKLALGRLDAAGLPRPKVLIAAEDVGRGKPDPEGYMAAALRLNRKTRDCIALEDSPAGLLAAHNAGCITIAVTTTHRAEQLQLAKAGGIIPNLAWVRVGRGDDQVHLTLRHT